MHEDIGAARYPPLFLPDSLASQSSTARRHRAFVISDIEPRKGGVETQVLHILRPEEAALRPEGSLSQVLLLNAASNTSCQSILKTPEV